MGFGSVVIWMTVPVNVKVRVRVPRRIEKDSRNAEENHESSTIFGRTPHTLLRMKRVIRESGDV